MVITYCTYLTERKFSRPTMTAADAPKTMKSESRDTDGNPSPILSTSISGDDETEWKAGRQEMLILATMSVLSIVIAVSVAVHLSGIFHFSIYVSSLTTCLPTLPAGRYNPRTGPDCTSRTPPHLLYSELPGTNVFVAADRETSLDDRLWLQSSMEALSKLSGRAPHICWRMLSLCPSLVSLQRFPGGERPSCLPSLHLLWGQ